MELSLKNHPLRELSLKNHQLARFKCAGLSHKEVAAFFNTSAHSVDRMYVELYKKFGCTRGTEFILKYIKEFGSNLEGIEWPSEQTHT